MTSSTIYWKLCVQNFIYTCSGLTFLLYNVQGVTFFPDTVYIDRLDGCILINEVRYDIISSIISHTIRHIAVWTHSLLKAVSLFSNAVT